MGTKNSDRILGNWTHHTVKNLPLGANAFELTEVTYHGKQLSLLLDQGKTMISTAYLVPLIESDYTILFGKAYGTMWLNFIADFNKYMDPSIWYCGKVDGVAWYCSA